MTKVAVLSIVLNVAIPFLLALLGGILAARSLPAETFHHERWWWIGSFIGLALIGIVLAFVQQVVLTTQQSEMDKKQADADRLSGAAQAQLRADNRFTQGQLDTMTKVLISVVSKNQGQGITADVLKALVAAVQPTPKSSSFKDAAFGLIADLEDTDETDTIIRQQSVLQHLGPGKRAQVEKMIQDRIRDLWDKEGVPQSLGKAFSGPVEELRRELAKRGVRNPMLDAQLRLLRTDRYGSEEWRQSLQLTTLKDIAKELREMLARIPPG